MTEVAGKRGEEGELKLEKLRFEAGGWRIEEWDINGGLLVEDGYWTIVN